MAQMAPSLMVVFGDTARLVPPGASVPLAVAGMAIERERVTNLFLIAMSRSAGSSAAARPAATDRHRQCGRH